MRVLLDVLGVLAFADLADVAGSAFTEVDRLVAGIIAEHLAEQDPRYVWTLATSAAARAQRRSGSAGLAGHGRLPTQPESGRRRAA